jgi:hypothetical protein
MTDVSNPNVNLEGYFRLYSYFMMEEMGNLGVDL